MGLRKAQIILFLYERLRSGQSVNLLDFQAEFEISYPTFHRYIAEIRAFLMNNFMPWELIFAAKDNTYRFEHI